jgi:hypothetical protein
MSPIKSHLRNRPTEQGPTIGNEEDLVFRGAVEDGWRWEGGGVCDVLVGRGEVEG